MNKDKAIENGIEKGLFSVSEDGKISYGEQEYSDNFDDPEEKVRAGIFSDLIIKYKYANSKNIVEFEKTRVIGHPYKKTSSRVDIIINREDKSPYAIFELKSEADYESYFEDSIKTQLFERAANEDKGRNQVKYLIYYTRYLDEDQLVEKFQTIDYSTFKTWEDWDDAGRPNLRIIPTNYSLTQTPPQYTKDSKKPESSLRDNVQISELNRIADDLHQILWGGGQHQNDLFFNLIGLFLAKIYDEKIKAKGEPFDFQIFFHGEKHESADETYERINKLYKGEFIEKDQSYSQCALNYLLGFQDDKLKKIPDISFDANKVKYVVEILQGISFTSNKFDVLGDFFEKIVRSELKQTKGQFLTHQYIVQFIVKCLDISGLAIDLINGKEGRPKLPYIIDPSCGSGTFQIESMKEVTTSILIEKEEFKNIKQTDDILEFLDINFPERKRNAWAKEYIYGTEINPDLAMATKVNMVGHGDGSANIFPIDGLIDFEKIPNGNKLNIKKESNVYEKYVNEQFDIIISNPPFSITVDRETAKQFPSLYHQGEKILKSLKKDAKKEIDTEILFMERYYHLLKTGGRLGVVLPESVFDTNSNRQIRLFMFKYFWIKAVVSLPNLTFAPYTMTKTSILFAQKKSEKQVLNWTVKWTRYEEIYKDLKDKYNKTKKKKDSPENSKALKQIIEELLNKNIGEDLNIETLNEKFSDEIKLIDSDWWTFNKVSKEIDHQIFFAHAEEVGYKRGANKIENRPNELFNKDQNGEIIFDQENPTTILDYFKKHVTWS